MRGTMKRSRLQAIEHIHVEAPAEAEERMIWFYTEVGGLDQHEPEPAADAQLCFKSARLLLFLRFVEDPHVDPVARRLTLRVPSLEEAAELLDEHKVAYQHVAGVSYTDQFLVVYDPAGHRIELRKEWPAL